MLEGREEGPGGTEECAPSEWSRVPLGLALFQVPGQPHAFVPAQGGEAWLLETSLERLPPPHPPPCFQGHTGSGTV